MYTWFCSVCTCGICQTLVVFSESACVSSHFQEKVAASVGFIFVLLGIEFALRKNKTQETWCLYCYRTIKIFPFYFLCICLSWWDFFCLFYCIFYIIQQHSGGRTNPTFRKIDLRYSSAFRDSQRFLTASIISRLSIWNQPKKNYFAKTHPQHLMHA